MKEHSSAALWALAAGNPENRVLIADAGAIEPLVGLIKQGEADAVKEHACGALWRISIENKANQAAIARAGAIPHICKLASGTDPQKVRTHTHQERRARPSSSSHPHHTSPPLLPLLASQEQCCRVLRNVTTSLPPRLPLRRRAASPLVKLLSGGANSQGERRAAFATFQSRSRIGRRSSTRAASRCL